MVPVRVQPARAGNDHLNERLNGQMNEQLNSGLNTNAWLMLIEASATLDGFVYWTTIISESPGWIGHGERRVGGSYNCDGGSKGRSTGGRQALDRVPRRQESRNSRPFSRRSPNEEKDEYW